jgi:nucleotide sugar dehydrogenase
MLLDLSDADMAASLGRGEITIGLVGIGRIGLPTAAVFAEGGAKVIGIDIDPEVVEKVNSGLVHIDEPGLDRLVASLVKKGDLRATSNVEKAARESDVLIICVPTPIDSLKEPIYSQVEAACISVGKGLRKGSLVIVESTVGPGTVENFLAPLLEDASGMRAGEDFGLASCPERADPGSILENLRKVPRIVGGIDGRSTRAAAALYRAAMGVKVVEMSNPKSANAVKLTENISRDVNIALMNELAILFERLGIDILEVIEAASTKWNFMPHYPGAGVGGPCIPSNPYYLIREAQRVGYIPHLIRMAREVNDRMPSHVVELVMEALNEIGKTVNGSRIALLGVSYKPDISDVQLSSVGPIIRSLRHLGADLRGYDPYFPNQTVLDLRLESSIDSAVKGADAAVLCTAHKEFRKLDFRKLSGLMSSPGAFIDARGVVDKSTVTRSGLVFRGVGRSS